MEEDPEDDLELVQNRIPWTDPGMESSAEETHQCPARSRERGPPQKPRPPRGPRGMGFKKGSESGYDRGYEKGKGKRMDIMGFEKDLLALDQALLQAGVSTYRDDPCRPRLSARGGSGPGVLRRVPPAPTVAVMDKVYSLAPAISARRSLWVRRQPRTERRLEREE